MLGADITTGGLGKGPRRNLMVERMGRNRIAQLLALMIVVSAAMMTIPGRAADADREWRFYGGDQGARQYSPLSQINRDNVKNLRIVWRQSAIPQEMRRGPDAPVPYSYSHTPLMVGGLLYMSSGYGTVAALDAATGKVVWFDSPDTVREQSPIVP